MKQQITEKQFNELSKAQKSVWSQFCRKNKYVEFDKGGNDFMLNGFPNIGEMIGFLDEEYSKGNKFSLSIERGQIGWILWESGEDTKELCDALWIAVKEVLKAK